MSKTHDEEFIIPTDILIESIQTQMNSECADNPWAPSEIIIKDVQWVEGQGLKLITTYIYDSAE
jgi:hypothetical protein